MNKIEISFDDIEELPDTWIVTTAEECPTIDTLHDYACSVKASIIFLFVTEGESVEHYEYVRLDDHEFSFGRHGDILTRFVYPKSNGEEDD